MRLKSADLITSQTVPIRVAGGFDAGLHDVLGMKAVAEEE
jgi:hypothetical protein